MIADSLIFLFILVISYALGHLLIRRLLQVEDSVLSISIALGFGIIGYLILAAGSAGFLYKKVFLLFGIAMLFLSVAYIIRNKAVSVIDIRRYNFLDKLLFIAIAAFGVITYLGAVAPAIGNDSLCYHLAIPRRFVLQNKISYIHYTINSLYPFFMEMLYTLGILLKGAVIAKLFHWSCGLLLASTLYFFTFKVIGRRREALIASLLIISSPGISHEMVYAYVDVGLTLYLLLGVMAMIFWMQNSKKSWLLLSGVFFGIALSIKYTALYMLIPTVFMLLWHILRERKKNSAFMNLARFFIPVFLLSFSWYLRSYIVFNNPVFPVFSDIFSAPISFDVSHHFIMGKGKGMVDFILLFWNMAFFPSSFGARGSQIGIQFLLFLPFVIYSIYKGNYIIRRIGFLAVSFTLIWFFMVQRDRFFYPVLPLYCFLMAYGIYLLKGRRKRIVFGILILITSFNLAVCLYHNRVNYAVALGVESRQDYLKNYVPNYPMAEFANENLDENAKILYVGGIRIYYFDRILVREDIFRMWKNYDKKPLSSKELLTLLRQEGFTHIIYEKSQGESKPYIIKRLMPYLKAIYTYGPVYNIDLREEQEFYLYSL